MFRPFLLKQRVVIDGNASCCIGGLIDTNESMAELEHVVSERDDDELRVLRPVLDVVGDDGDVAEV